MTVAVKEDLGKVVNLKRFARLAKENRQGYLKSIVREVSLLPIERWDTLDTRTKEWVNGGIKALNDITEIPDFEKGKKPRKSGRKEVYRILCENPSLSFEEVKELLEVQEIQLTDSGIRSYMRTAKEFITILQDLGKL